ncbi:MAG: MATE family efflux transporter [Succinivibrio sp.]|nr:MATE family efflux transporter [Succinivibrio sp.]
MNIKNYQTYKKEIKNQLKLFVPFLLGQLSSCAMGTVDTVMAGLYGTVDISGVAIACSFYWPAYLCLAGVASALTPTVSHLLGAKREKEIPDAFYNALIVCIICSMIIMLLLSQCYRIFNFIDADAAMVKVAVDYLFFVMLSIPATVIFNLVRALFDGHSYIKPSLVICVIMLILNIPLNYIFIFGKCGIPAMGGVGCGITSCIINFIAAAMFYIYMKKTAVFKPYFINYHFNFDFGFIKKFVKLCVPIGISRTMEVACFSLASVIIASFGPTIVAAHSICINISSLIFMIPFSLCLTATIRTAYAMGEKSFEKALISLKSVSLLNMILLLIYISTTFILREFFASLYTNDPYVIELASSLLIINCIFMLPDSIQIVLMGVVQGFKDSKTVFFTTLFAYWMVGLPLSYTLSHGTFTEPLKAHGIWISFTVTLLICSIIYALRVRYIFKNKAMPKLLLES